LFQLVQVMGDARNFFSPLDTMVSTRNSGVHYPEISDPLNPDSRTQRNEHVFTKKSCKCLCSL